MSVVNITFNNELLPTFKQNLLQRKPSYIKKT